MQTDLGAPGLAQLICPWKIQMNNCQLPEIYIIKFKNAQHNFISINPCFIFKQVSLSLMQILQCFNTDYSYRVVMICTVIGMEMS